MFSQACSEEGKAVAAIILGRAETIGYWPPGFQEYFAVMLKQETGWKQMVVQQVKHHCESSMTEEDELGLDDELDDLWGAKESSNPHNPF